MRRESPYRRAVLDEDASPINSDIAVDLTGRDGQKAGDKEGTAGTEAVGLRSLVVCECP